jgi:DUF3048 family protein
MHRFRLAAWLLPAAAVLVLAACGGQSAAPASTPSPSAAQPVPSDTATPEPTSTPLPTSTPVPVVRSPLTDLPVDAPADLSRRPVLVKIGNSGAERPQSGLSQADVVYESVTEGGITRYAALFQSHEASTIGPIRSARLSDLQIAPEWGAVLAHVGASSPIMAMLRSGKVLDLDQFFYQQYYQRTKDRVAPYNVYTSIATLLTGARDRGFSLTVAPLAAYTFAQPGQEDSAHTIDFDFAPETHTQYVYDAGQHAYHQIEYGAPTTDAATGQPVPIANLVVQFAPVQATNIIEDANGSHSLDYNLVGSGKALVFRGGDEVQAGWSRAGLTGRTTFTDAAGKPIAFEPGATWIALVRPGTPVTVRSV